MNSLRCFGLLLVMLVSACDADKEPAPPTKVAVQAPAVVPEVKVVQEPATVEKAALLAPPIHNLQPYVPVVPVLIARKADSVKSESVKQKITLGKAATVERKVPEANAKSAKIKADNAQQAHRPPPSGNSKSASQMVKETRLPPAALDLSLPADMVRQLSPPPNIITGTPKAKSPATMAKPLLPKMFPETESEPDFQLQGRLLSNEMQLQLRNEARREVEGAALDFKFKQ